MYAVIKTGGKQHRVKPGDVIEVEHIPAAGGTLTFHPLLVVDDAGKAHVGKEAAAAVVTARPVGEQKGDKVKVVKYRPKTGYARKTGHRQLVTLLEIEDVKLGGAARKAAPKKAEKPEEAPAEAPVEEVVEAAETGPE